MGVPGSIASYVFDTGDGLALVDTGPSTTLPALERGLQKLGAASSDVRHILLTHIHFDHAGAAGSLAARLPRASVYVHERGAKHLSRPERLIASAAQIYGDQMQTLWGEMQPVPAERLIVLHGGETLAFSGLPEGVKVHYTPGHAVHHVSYHAGDDLYVGDVGGVRIALPQTSAPAHPAARHRPGGLGAEYRPAARPPGPAAAPGAFRQLCAERSALGRPDRQHPHRRAAGRHPAGGGRGPGKRHPHLQRRVAADLDAEEPGLADKFVLACPPWMSVQGLARYFREAGTEAVRREGAGRRRRRARTRHRRGAEPRAERHRGALHARQPRHGRAGPPDPRRPIARRRHGPGARRGG